MSNLQGLLEQQSRHASVEGKESQQQYLSSCLPHLTSEFREAADAYLELDSSVRCPVHSQLLSAYSEALCRALTASTGAQKVLRLRGCDARDLVNILESIYSRGSRVKTVDAAVSLTKLADIFNDGTLRAECDAFLTRSADRPCSILAQRCASYKTYDDAAHLSMTGQMPVVHVQIAMQEGIRPWNLTAYVQSSGRQESRAV